MGTVQRLTLRWLHAASVCAVVMCSPGPSAADTSSSSSDQSGGTTKRSQPIWNATHTDRLKHDLLFGYDKFTRPQEHYNTTEVNLALSIKYVNLDEFANILTLEAWMKLYQYRKKVHSVSTMAIKHNHTLLENQPDLLLLLQFWDDTKLTWNASQYGNLSELSLAEHEVWQPDLVLYNGLTSTGYMTGRYDTGQVVVRDDGTVFWAPMTRLDVFCPLDLSNWPYGEHTCTLQIGSWVHSAKQLNVSIADYEPVSVEMHSEGGPWEVVHAEASRATKKYPCCPDEYVAVYYDVTVRRKAVAYRTVILAPATVSIILCLTSFWLPPLSPHKIFVGGVNAIVLCIFLAYIAHLVPVLTEHTPYVVLLYVWTLYLVCAYMVMTVVAMNLSRMARPCPLAPVLRRWGGHPLLCLFVAHSTSALLEPQETQAILCMESATDLSVEGPGSGTAGLCEATQRRDWTNLATVVDRIVFLVFCLAFLILTICLS